MTAIRFLFLMLTLVCSTAACNPTLAPILNVDEAVSVPVDGTASVERTHKAIRAGLADKSWKVVSDEPGLIVASIQAGGHSAKVKIKYDAKRYSIHHLESSPGLGYDGSSIHRRYNHWINLLRKAIDRAAQ